MPIVSELRLLFRLRRQLIKNDVTHLTKEKVLRFGLLGGLGLIFFGLDYWFFHRIISYIARIDVMDMVEVGTILVARLLNMTFLTFLAMLLFSNVVIALSTFYLSSDLPFLLSSPLRFSSVFTLKFVETTLNSSTLLLIFGLPIFIVCGQEYGVSWLYYLAIPVMLLPFIVIPATLGTGLTMALVRFFPVKRVHQVLTVFGLILGGGVVILFRFLRPEQLVDEIGINQMLSYIQQSRIPTSPYLPSTWATEVLMSLIEGNRAQTLVNLGWLFGAAGGLYLLALLLAQRIYYDGWTGNAESRTVKTMQRMTLSEHWVQRMTWLHPATRALLIKDLKLFWRDTTQWSQLLMLAALLIIYFFNIKSLPLRNIYIKNLISFLNLGLAGFVLASLGARFIFPSTSLEGSSFWVVHSSPMVYRRFLLAKFSIFLLPLLVLAETLVIISNLLLGVSGYMMLLSTGTICLITIGLTGLGVGMGAIYPKFINENPAQIAISVGGVLYMILSLVYIGVTIVLEAWPVYMYFSQRLFHTPGVWGRFGLYAAYGLVVGLSVGVTVIPMYLGVKRLQGFEII
jgi:ABC-2 type transport system permease protein